MHHKPQKHIKQTVVQPTPKETYKQRMQAMEDECRQGFRGVIADALTGEGRPEASKPEWQTILVGDGMGRVVKLNKKCRDESGQWESLQEKRDRKYKQGKYFIPKPTKKRSNRPHATIHGEDDINKASRVGGVIKIVTDGNGHATDIVDCGGVNDNDDTDKRSNI